MRVPIDPMSPDALTLTPLEPGTLHTAALRVCERATDPDDARQLLEALNLLDPLRDAAPALAGIPR